MAARATIADVARACRLSKSTVSKALNLAPGQVPLRAETRRQIVEAAARLGYTPSWRGRMLAQRKTFQVGLLFKYSIPDFRGVYEPMLRQLTDVLEASGYNLLFIPTHGPRWRQIVLDQRLDGCVITQSLTPELADVLRASNMPAVQLNERGPTAVNQVAVDDVQGGRLAVEHLVSLGHRRIAYVRASEGSLATHSSVPERRDGYLAGMRAAGLADAALAADEPLAAFVDRVPLGPAGGGYTAVISYMHTEAVELLRLLTRRGLRVPRDVSLIGFNDVFPLAVLDPAVTAVDVPGGDVGRAAGKLLLQQIELGGPPQQVVLPERLVVRESTAPPGAG